MAFFALTACLALTPMTTQAQTSVPYTTTVGGEYPPGGWIANYYGSLYYNGWEYYGFQTGPIVLPEFNAPTNTLTVDVQVKPFYNIAIGADFSIGYYTDVNNLSSFQSVEVFNYYDESWSDEWRFKRAVLSNVPANARIGFYAWYPCFINLVYVHETPDPFDVPYSTAMSSWDHYQPDGWIANNWMGYGSESWFRSGVAALPKFTSNLNTLQLDISLKPRNSNAQSIQIGYITGDNPSSSSFVALQTFSYSSSWDDYQSKRITYTGGHRMAFKCTGEWVINGVKVTPINSTTTYAVPYQPNLGMFLPEGWLASNYGYSGNAYLKSGVALLPQFNATTSSLEMDVSIRPKNSSAQSIQIGYVTNNNPSSFTAQRTYYYSSSLTGFQPKRIIYYGVPSGARMAIKCNGDWEIRNLKVKYPISTVTLPYTPTLGDPIPDGWVTDNYYITSGETYLSNYTVLPRPNGNSFQFDLSLKPFNSNSQSITIGYVTNAYDAPSTFTALQTFNYESTWYYYESKRVLFSSLPSGARPAIRCTGSWYVRDLSVHAQPSASMVPYNVSLGSVQPDGWLANNYSYNSNAYLKTGTALLRVFSPALTSLQLDISLKPNNSNAQNIQIGYVNSSNTFVALQTYSYNSSWSAYQPKSISYSGVPSGTRMAIKCNGEWSIATVHVDYIPGTVPYPVPYEPTLGTLMPGGWTTECYYYSNGAYLTTGYTQLPVFVPNLNTLQLDFRVKPKNSNAQYIKVGYFYNSSTFVPLQTFNYSSSWGGLRHKRILYNVSGVPANARMAIYCNGEWNISDLSVNYIPDPISVPYTCDCFGNDCVGNDHFYTYQPSGWVANNFAASANAMEGALFESGCVMLPRFTTPINALEFRMDIKPYVGFDGVTPTSISLGYVTNDNPSTFVACQTYSYSSSWGVPIPKTVTFPSAPSNARIAFYCNGGWRCDNFKVTIPTQSIPYTEGFESTSANELPVGWSASSMSVKYGSYNGVSTYSGSCQLVGSSYALLPFFDTELNTTTIEFWCRPESTSNGGIVRVGYVPNGGSLSSFVSVKDITWNTNWTGYRLMRVTYKNAPAGARAVIYCSGYGSGTNLFHLDNFQIKQPPVLTVPLTQNFNSTTMGSLPDGWLADNIRAGYKPYGNDAPHSGNRQLYGTGVLVLPEISGGFEGVQVDMWLRPSTSSSNLTFYAGYITNPNNPSSFVPTASFSGSNWTAYQQKHVSYTLANSSSYPTGARMAFKAVAPGTDCWYIDDISLSEFDNAAPTLTLNNVGSHIADISWVPGGNGQEQWDVYYADWNLNNNIQAYTLQQLQEYGTLVHITNSQYNYTISNLTAGVEYYAWLRYRRIVNGIVLETSLWSNPVNFETEENCAPPTNIQVETTLHSIFVSWEPGQSNQTSWVVQISGSDYWEYDTDETSIEIDATGMLEPGEAFEVGVQGNCTGNDGNGQSEWIDAQMQDYPTLTVNDSYSSDETVPITGFACGSQMSRTQFIIPASQLTDMQYSRIMSMTFESDHVEYGQPWGSDARFDVYLKEVDWDDFSDGEFYDWDDMTLVYTWPLSINNYNMTVTFNNTFNYSGGNLLVGFYQETYDFTPGTNADHLNWMGVNNYNNNPNYKPSIYYNTSTGEPFAQTFCPKVTFSYETDDYLPPTDFEAEVTGSTEVSFSWTMRDGQTSTEIKISSSPDFTNQNFSAHVIDNHCTINNSNFFQPETTYYYRYRGRYQVGQTTYYSAWSPSGNFTMPEACDPPTNLQVNAVGPFTATLTWDSNGESDYVEYREAVGESLQTEISQGFERVRLPSGWIVENSGGGSGWEMAYTSSGTNRFAHTGRGCIGSTNTGGVANSWLFIPVSNLRGYLTFWTRATAENVSSNRLEVYYTTSLTIPSGTSNRIYTETVNSATYTQVSLNLTNLQGPGYIVIHHFLGTTNSPLGIVIDDLEFQSYVTDYSEWVSLGSTEDGQFDIVGLTPGTTYQARVRSLCDTGFTSEWIESVNFSTPGNIAFADANVKAICVANWDTNNDNELSYAEAAAVTTLNPSGASNNSVFKNNQTITFFNELQYFTGLTAIDDYAFAGCASLSAITLPNTITSIGDYAFGYSVDELGYPIPCSSLHSIVIPPSVTTINYSTFRMSGLTEINLPYSVTSIGGLAFGECNSLVSVYIPATVTSISSTNAFTGANIASIEVDEGNPIYDSRNGCNAIIETATNKLLTGCKNTVVPYGVTAIGVSAFENCTNLTDITLPATMETLGNYAFLNCTSLNTIEVNAATPPTLGNASFGNLTLNNIKVYVPCGSLEDYQTSDWSGFDLVENCNIEFEDLLTKQICVEAWDRNYDGELSYREAAAVDDLHNAFHESSITRFNELQYFTGLDMIYEDDFADCANLTAVTFPPTLIYIDGDAFLNCSSLASITFGENIGTVHTYAFYNCTGLNFIKVEATTPPTLGENAFYGAETNIPVYVPCGTKSAYQNDSDWDIFDNNSFIDFCDTIHFADAAVRALCVDNWDDDNDGHLSYAEAAAVTDLGEVFRGQFIHTFDELQHFTGLTKIGNYAFMGCPLMSSVTMPATVTKIGNLAFFNDISLTTIDLPPALRTISVLAFSKCFGLESVNIPPLVTEIQFNPFEYCSALNSITVDASNPIYDSRNGCNAIIETETNTIVVGCKNTVIPDNVTALGSNAFSGQTSITSITLPANITELGNGVFEDATNLAVIYAEATTPPTMGYEVFYGLNLDDITVYVPCESVEDYQAAPGWSEFPNLRCDAEILTVYDGTATSNRLPAYIYYFDEFSRSQYVIPAADLEEMAGYAIRSMTFYTTSDNVPYTTVSNADVYLKEVDYTEIDAYETKASATLVYSGLFNIVSAGDGGKMIINFTEPYFYQGGNLLVGIENTENNWYEEIYFYGQQVTGASISSADPDGLENVEPQQQNFIPKTTFNYLSPCEPKALPYTYGFEDAGEFDCWTLLHSHENTGLYQYANHSGNYGFRFFYNQNPPQYLISPEFEGTTAMDLSFSYMSTDGDYPETFQVGYSTTTKSPDAFTWHEEVTADDPNNWMQYEDYFPEGTKYVAVKLNSDDMYMLFLDDFSFTPNYCPLDDRCQLTFVLNDSYGDGWNGASINVVDVVTNSLLTSMSAPSHGGSNISSTDTYTLSVCDGRELRFEWVSGSWDNECSYTVTGINGNTIFSGSGAMSPPVTYMVNCSDSNPCEAPTDLNSTVEGTMAMLSWTGIQDNYNVRYKTAGGFFDDFENGLDGWTIIRNDGGTDQTDWHINIENGNHAVISWSWLADVAYSVDNWLITPQVTLGGTLKFKVKCDGYYPDQYQVLVSTSGTEISGFLPLNDLTEATGEWTEKSFDLSAYAGQQGYIAIRHMDEDKDWLMIDDFGIYTGDWVEVNGVTNPTTLQGLAPETTYEWQVQGVDCDGEGSVTDWSETSIFTTEGTAAVTQTMTLSAGWNWVSLSIEVENPIAMLQMLEAGMGANGIQIKSGDVYTEYDAEWGWFGDLDELGVVNEQMYKIHVSAPCTITLEGMPINPEGHAITINKGWNWIGFPSAVAMSLDDAFAGFAQDGDIIRNSDGETPYDAEWEMWIGDLETLVPGQGYMYYSASNTPRTLVFPANAK